MEKGFDENDIRSVTLSEAVRLRPQLHLQEIFEAGTLDALPVEACCHAIDEFFDGNCTRLDITVSGNTFVLEYDAGMSLDSDFGYIKAEKIMTALFACRNEKKHLEVGSEFCRLGIAVVNCTMEHCELVTVSAGQKGVFRFEAGITVHKEVAPTGEADHTILRMQPDSAIFGDLRLTLAGVTLRLEQLAARLGGLTVTVKSAG